MEKITLAIKNAFFNRNSQMFVFGLFSIFFIFCGMETGKYAVAMFPALLLCSIVIYFKPQLILLFFLASFYAGIQLYTKNMLMVDIADFTIMILFLGFFSKLFQQKKVSFENSGTKNIIGALIAFLIIAMFSIILNVQTKKPIDVFTSLWYIFNLIELIMVLVIFSQKYFQNIREMSINLVLLFSIIEVIAALYQYSGIGGEYASVESLRDVRGTFSNHHAMLGNMMVLMLAFCLYRSIISKNVMLKLVYISGILFSIYMVIISGSRSTLFGIFATIACYLIINIKLSKKFIIYSSILVTTCVCLFLFSPVHDITLNTFKNNQTNQLDLSSYGRLLVWKGAIQHFIEAPVLNKLFGIGFGNYYTMKYSFSLVEGNKNISGGHNNYLHALTETGIIGLIVFMLLFILILVKLKKQSKINRLSFVYFYATIALLFSGFTQETFWFQPAFYRFWLIYIFFLGLCLSSREKEEQSSEKVI